MKIVICGANSQLGRALQASLDGHTVGRSMQHPQIMLPPWEQGLKELAEEKKRGTH